MNHLQLQNLPTSTYKFGDAAATEGYVPATANANATTLRDSASTVAG
jgi:hypothetical protein